MGATAWFFVGWLMTATSATPVSFGPFATYAECSAANTAFAREPLRVVESCAPLDWGGTIATGAGE